MAAVALAAVAEAETTLPDPKDRGYGILTARLPPGSPISALAAVALAAVTEAETTLPDPQDRGYGIGNIEHPTLNVEHRTSNAQRRTSNVGPRNGAARLTRDRQSPHWLR
ncbi:hypothetical protein SH580_10370 [Coraliomargarita algicola]|uniref:Uncharacterized protein n=1 Tax=Coraliomargarita algicola TaxID=3092156 RepID=A0ABZ0RS00_9BACT|nr:hypothetical protein [Coraliomargarita sp. J2-16]WPJ98103.1 hypothetical protein SH580_10370 [Coraliomargarita sp. J2-16]